MVNNCQLLELRHRDRLARNKQIHEDNDTDEFINHSQLSPIQYQFKEIVRKFNNILQQKSVIYPLKTVILSLCHKYLKKKNTFQNNKIHTNKLNSFSTTQREMHSNRSLKTSNNSLTSIIDLSDQTEDRSQPIIINHRDTINQTDKIVVLEDSQEINGAQQKDNILKFPSKTIENQTGRIFYLLDDPFVPKIYAESLTQDYIEFRNKNFSYSMPVQRAQQRKNQKEYKNNRQKLFDYNQVSDPQHHKKYQRQVLPMETQFLWKNRIKQDKNYLANLSEIWTLEQNSITKKKQMLKRFHEERELAKVFITDGYGIKIARKKMELFYDMRAYHRANYTIAKQAFRCIQQDLIQKYKKSIKPYLFKDFRKLLGFLLNFHNSFRDEEMKQIFIRYIKIAYKIECDIPDSEQCQGLYKFILKDVFIPGSQQLQEKPIQID